MTGFLMNTIAMMLSTLKTMHTDVSLLTYLKHVLVYSSVMVEGCVEYPLSALRVLHIVNLENHSGVPVLQKVMMG